MRAREAGHVYAPYFSSQTQLSVKVKVRVEIVGQT